MTLLLLGLFLFLGTHSVRIFANDWANSQIKKRGPSFWKISYTLLSLVGFFLIIKGYGLAQESRILVWSPPLWAGHLTALLTLLSFILLASSKRPKNLIYASVKHPMIIAVKVWALGHLLANGSLAAIVLFGSFLVWAILDFRSSRQRDSLQMNKDSGSVAIANWQGTLPAIFIGILTWGFFAFYLHRVLIGVQPLMK
jgi:uncharacterized membrane protein